MIILSITNHNEASACIYDKKKNIIYAASEERFVRKKNYKGFPRKSINFLLKKLDINLDQINKFVYCTASTIHPSKKIKKQIDSELKDLNDYDKKIYLKRLKTEIQFNKKYITNFKNWLKKNKIKKNKVSYIDHHEAHARSSILCQKKNNGYILTADGKGGFTSSAIWKFVKNKLICLSRNTSFNSLGYLYGNVTILLGYKAERHEGKITGLSSYGEYQQDIDFTKLFSVNKNKIICRNIKNKHIPFFLKKKNNWGVDDFFSIRNKYSKEDIAATVQGYLEKIFKIYVNKNIPKKSNLLLAGGIFANVKLNKKIYDINPKRYLFVAPPMSDIGLCVGGIHLYKKKNFYIKNMYLGPDYENKEILSVIDKYPNLKFTILKKSEIFSQIVKKLNNKKIIGIFNNKMEFGPRALCNRSIIFPATNKHINNIVNKRLNRTEFMPFAPVSIEKFASKNFKNFKKKDDLAKFMTVTYDCTKYFINNYPGACHVDNTARPQILYERDNKWFYDFLNYYYKKTKQTCIMNTSFNNHEEPIVCTPKDAIKSLINKNVDLIIFNKNILVSKI